MAYTTPDHPELMVIGDSLAQGVRSLTAKASFFAGSVGARLAESQDWPFRSPDHPRPVLLDFAEEIRRLSLTSILFLQHELEEFTDRINDNIAFWMNRLLVSGPVDVAPFDNVAVAQAYVSDLFVPASQWRAKLRTFAAFRLTAADLLAKRVSAEQVAGLYKAINFVYTLNPANRPEWDDLSMVGWVQARRPRRLLVTIGHNEAIYKIGFQGVTVPIRYHDLEDSPLTASEPSPSIPAPRLTTLARTLAGLNDLNWVLWDLLPKISAVANLEPVGVPTELTSPIGGANYYSFYSPVFSTNNRRLSGQYLKKADEEILSVNRQVQAVVSAEFLAAGRSGAIQFFDDFELFNRIDFKNQANRSSPEGQRHRITIPPVRHVHYIDNCFLQAWMDGGDNSPHRGAPVAPYRLTAGGVQSLDGMHLTASGYAYKATEIVAQFGTTAGLRSDLMPNVFARATQSDDLVGDFPMEVNTVRTVILNPLRAFQPLLVDQPDTPDAPVPEHHAKAQCWADLCQVGA